MEDSNANWHSDTRQAMVLKQRRASNKWQVMDVPIFINLKLKVNQRLPVVINVT